MKDKGEDLRRQGEASDPDQNGVKERGKEGRRQRGGLRLQHSSEKVLARPRW